MRSDLSQRERWRWSEPIETTNDRVMTALDATGKPQPPRLTSSTSVEDTVGTCSPSEAREIEMRVLLKTLSRPAWVLKLLRSSETSTLFWPLESSATLPGVAEVRI